MTILCLTTGLVLSMAAAPVRRVEGPAGYYRFPAIHGQTVVFVAEGDLWKVGLNGGTAARLTTHLAEETNPALSPDGQTIAYTARYEGPAEVYTIPIEGGLPKQHTWEGVGATVVGWTADGKIIYATRRYSTLPNLQLVTVDPKTNDRALVPLAQAADGSYDARTLFFTRLPWQGSHTKRYKGGTVQNIWKWDTGAAEAVPVTGDYKGTSKTPMVWNGRVYFASDRTGAKECKTVAGKQDCDWKAGIMNIWSVKTDGSDPQQHTQHKDFDVQSPSLHDGRIVYQQGADLWLVDVRGSTTLAKASNGSATTAAPQRLNITLTTDLEHLRDRWVKNPTSWISDFHISPNGDRLAMVARGQVFVAPVGSGRLVEIGRSSGVRFREAKVSADGKSVYVLSDQSGELELWRFPANGIGKGEQLTTDGKILRWDFIPSPDGKYIAHHDKNNELFVYDVAAKRNKRISAGKYGGQGGIKWSSDSKWLSFHEPGENQLTRVRVYGVDAGQVAVVTSDRYDSFDATFSKDNDWLFFRSDRVFNTSVPAPWGSRQPEPYYNNQTRIYALQLRSGAKWPFGQKTELDTAPAVAPAREANVANTPSAPATAAAPIDLQGAATRIFEVPLPPGNYANLNTDGTRLYYVTRDDRYTGGNIKINTLELRAEAKPEVFLEGVGGYELSMDGKKVLIQRGNDFFVINAGAKAPASLTDSRVSLDGWQFALDRKEELQSLFNDAWRLERDYFYDPGMHGVDWNAMRTKYAPLAARVTDRWELNDVVAQMVGELSALHIFVRGGDLRAGADTIVPASLGGTLEKDAGRGGWRVSHVYQSDPDIPDELSPLARVGVDVRAGDVITAIDGVATLSVEHPAILLNNKVGKQVLISVQRQGAAARDVIVTPISMGRETDLRYDEWEYTRRLLVDSLSGGKVGYVHLRAMGGPNMTEFTREFYPVFNRDALVIDVRQNNGGNIDSWLLEKLQRKAWMYWQPRVGEPYWNQNFAFRGHMITVVNEYSASDGEAFPEGFRRLGLGKILGTRTWGGEIWLSQNNFMADRGIATAAEIGVYGPDGEWLIEGWGVDPDIVVDNTPRATFLGRDEQLATAVRTMLEEVRKNPNPVPRPKPYPKK